MFKKKLILLIGNYNASNLGDNVLMRSALNGIVKNFDDYKVNIVAPRKPYDAPLLPTGFRSFFFSNWLKTLYVFSRSRYAVFGGGGLLNTEEYKSVLIWGLQILVLRFLKVEVILLANSFNQTDSKLLKYILSKVSLISVRDKQSFDFLNKLELDIPIRKTADLAFGYSLENHIEDEFEFDFDEFVVFSLRPYSKVNMELQRELLVKSISHILERTKFGVYLAPFAVEDVRFLRTLVKQFDSGRVVVLPLDGNSIITALAKSKIVVAQRLHAVIFSILLSKPTLVLSYSSKVMSLANCFFDEIDVFDLQGEINLDFFLERIDFLLKSDAVNFDLNELENAKKETEMNFDLLKSFIV